MPPSDPALRLISWNMSHSKKAWPFLLADALPDIALLQEAIKPPHLPYWSSPPLEETWCIQGNPKEFGPASAERQIDFVFASEELHERMNVRAVNTPKEWGP